MILGEQITKGNRMRPLEIKITKRKNQHKK